MCEGFNCLDCSEFPTCQVEIGNTIDSLTKVFRKLKTINDYSEMLNTAQLVNKLVRIRTRN